MTLFDPEFGLEPKKPKAAGEAASNGDAPLLPNGVVVRVVPDVLGVPRTFDYLWPERLGEPSDGAIVRIRLNGRNVRAWVIAKDPDTPAGVVPVPITKVTGIGPSREVQDLCAWAAWRWIGRLPSMLRVATADRAVRAPLRTKVRHVDLSAIAATAVSQDVLSLVERGAGTHVFTVSPDTDPSRVAAAVCSLGQALFIAPGVHTADSVQRLLARLDCSVARWPHGFAAGAGGHSIVGGRSAVFATMPHLCCIVVWDEHDERLQNESSPTWHPREVAIERARRLGIPCILISPCPSLEALAAATSPPESLAANLRRSGWAAVQVLDRRTEDVGRSGLFSEALVSAIRRQRESGRRVICVLNRTGRARLVACAQCGATAACERCGAAAILPDGSELLCLRCDTTRPVICESCGATHMKLLRLGVTKAAGDLEVLLGEPVLAVTANTAAATGDPTSHRLFDAAGVLLGTEAVLHRVSDAGLVAFLDFDQELLAPRYRAAEEALALVVRASRLTGGRADSSGGAVLLQTRMPDHEVCRSAVSGDPGSVQAAEAPRREILRMPPAAGVASVGGSAAPEWIERLGSPSAVEVQGPTDGWWLLRSDSTEELCDAGASVERPAGTLRLRVDPVRLRH